MRPPARHVAGNLIVNPEGEMWALLRVTGPTYGRMPRKDKVAWHSRLTAALMTLPGDAMLLGVSRVVEPNSVVSAMIDGVDVERHPRWAEVALGTLDSLREAAIVTRSHYLAFCLPGPHGANKWSHVTNSAMARVGQQFRLPPVPVSGRLVRAARAQADDLTRPLANFLGPERVTPATESEIEWLYARAALRGIEEPSLEEFRVVGGAALSAARLASVGEAVMYEGGLATDADRPRHRRYLRIDSERGTTFQSFGVLSHMPAEFAYPDGRGEVLARLDEFDLPIDWCVRITPTANHAARLKITGQIRQLASQFEEYGGDLAGPPGELPDHIETLRQEVARLNASPSAPELRATFIVTVSGPDLRTVEERFDRLRSFMQANEYRLPRPTGEQRACWGAMLPGSLSPKVTSDYGQFLLPSDLAGCAPFAGSALGDPTGDLLGLNLDGNGRPVLFWAGTGPNTPPPDGPMSGSIAIFGVLGTGKSYLMKLILAATVEMGGRVILTDRTPMGEYVRLAEPLRGSGHSAQTIEIGKGARVCLDPLLVFSGEDRHRYGTGFLTLLTGTPPTDPQGAMLSDAVRRVADRGGRLRDVPDALRSAGETDPSFAAAAAHVALKVQVFMRGPLASLVFGDGPPVRLDADYSVFHAPTLSLPSREAMADRSSLMPEQVFSQALLYLITAVSSSVAFSERDRLSVVVQDEGYALDTPQGRELLGLILRDGRKHNAVLLYGSHHPDDLDPRLQELVGSRFLGRMDRNAAPAGLRFMGMEATEANMDVVDASARQVGQFLYRDLQGRLGLIQVLPPRTADLRHAFDTGLTRAHLEANGHSGRRAPRPKVTA